MSDWTKTDGGARSPATPSEQRKPAGGGASSDTGASVQDAKATATHAAQDVKETAKETVAETKAAAMDTAQQIKGDVQAQASEVVGEAKQQATELMGQAKEQASSAFSKQQEQAVGGLGSLADALRETAQKLKEGEDGAQAGIASFVEDAADRLAQSADFLRDKDPNQLLHDVQDFAKKQPVAFVGAALGIGLVAARLLKSGGAGSAQLNQVVGSLSEQATQAMDTVKDRVSDLTGGSDDSGGTSSPSQASGGSASGGSTASSPVTGSGGFGQMDETASDFEVGQTPGSAGTTSGGSTGMSGGYAPDVPGASAGRGRS